MTALVVVDSSVTVSWLLPDEGGEYADAALERLGEGRGVAPLIWWYEVRNVLAVNERRGRLSREQVDDALGVLVAMPIDIDEERDSVNVVAIARRHGLTVYYAAYLEVASRRGLPIATLDARLAAAARSAGLAFEV